MNTNYERRRRRFKIKAFADLAAVRSKKTDTYGGPVSGPFALFLDKLRDSYHNKSLKLSDVYKEGVKLWEAMSDTDKAPYVENRASDVCIEHSGEFPKIYPQIVFNQTNMDTNYERRSNWRTRYKRKALTDLASVRSKKTDTYGGPVSSPFALFLDELQASYNDKSLRLSDVYKEGAQLWEAMSDTDKAPYVEKCAADIRIGPINMHPNKISVSELEKSDIPRLLESLSVS